MMVLKKYARRQLSYLLFLAAFISYESRAQKEPIGTPDLYSSLEAVDSDNNTKMSYEIGNVNMGVRSEDLLSDGNRIDANSGLCYSFSEDVILESNGRIIRHNSEEPFLWGLLSKTGEDGTLHDFTFALWFYHDPVNMTSDEQRMIIYGSDDTGHKVGILHDKKSIYMRRYVEYERTEEGGTLYNTADDAIPYDHYQWLPVTLADASGDPRAGWYFLAMTQTQFITRIFTGHKDDAALSCRYHQIGNQWLMPMTRWGLGRDFRKDGDQFIFEPDIKAVAKIDDFAVWGAKKEADQINDLFICSKTQDPNLATSNCWDNIQEPAARLIEEEQVAEEISADDVLVNDVLVYPNPVENGKLTVSIQLAEASPVEMKLVDLSGRTIMEYREDQELAAGKHDILIDNLRVGCDCNSSNKSTLYLLKVRTKDHEYSRKIIVR